MVKYSKELHGSKARAKLLKGAARVNRAVSATLGARGRNQIIWKEHRTKVINDGVKTAVEINPKDPFENAGAEILKQSAQRQMEVCGDGTTLVVILAFAIASEALKIVESGVNPMTLRSSLEKGRDLLIKEIRKLSKPIKSKEEKIQVATIASDDPLLGKMIGETYHKAGVDAVITAEQVSGVETFIDHREGVQIDSGYKDAWFITNPKAMTATVTRPKILVTDYKLDNIHDLIPLINDLVEKNERNVVVIAEDIGGSVLASLIGNKVKGKLNALAIKAPSFQTDKVLQDIATVVGAKFVSSKVKMDLKKLTTDDLGSAERVTSTKDATVVIGGGGKTKDVKDRISSIKKLIEDEDNEFEREKLKERLARLTGGVYVVRVGGATEVEAEEKYERADDAIKATRAAIEGGVVPGGEVVFLHILDILKPKNENEDYAFRILRNALEKPFRKLVTNAGLDSGNMMANLKNKEFEYGVDVIDGKVKNLVNAGILDPAMVLEESVRNAVSVSTSLITSDGVICEYEEKE